MRTKLNTPKAKAARPYPYVLARQTLVGSVILGGIFLSLSEMTNATNRIPLWQSTGDNAPTHVFQQPFKTALHSNFIRDIRTAIAARWHSSQLRNFVQVIVQQPGQASVSPLTHPVQANSFKPLVGQTFTYDSNILRAPDGSARLDGRSKSDFIKQIRAGIAAKWAISRQLLLVKAIVNQNWYSTYDELDYLGRDIQVDWNWQLGKYWTGNIGYQNRVTRGPFDQINSLTDNLQTTSQYFAKGEYQFTPSWFLHGGGLHRSSSYEGETLQTNNLDENIGNIGLKHVTPSNNTLGVSTTLTSGEFPSRTYFPGSFADDAFTRYDFDFEWQWQYSIKTRFDGKVGYAQQRSKHLHERDFSAPTVSANLNWAITGKTALQLSGWREIQFVNYLNANFVLSQGIRITPIWLLTPKLQFMLPMSYEQQDYLGDPGFNANATTGGENDTISKIGFNMDYNPLDNAKMSLFMKFEDRSSTQLTRNYQSNSVGLDMQFDF